MHVILPHSDPRETNLDTELICTRRWVERVVVGLSLCPFATDPFRNNTIRYATSKATDAHDILADLLNELSILDGAGGPRTTLLVIAEALSEFEDYLDLFAAAEALIEQTEHADRYQLVSFHPEYIFAGADPDDVANQTNRAPFPTIHILRRADVARAIREHDDVTSIPDDNITRLRALGIDAFKKLLAAVP